MRHLIIASLLFCTPVLAAEVNVRQQAPVAVGTIIAERKPITRTTDFVGRVEAIERVDVRARVTGFLQKILFNEGDVVKAGAPLYQIEPDTFEAAVLRARGTLFQAQGNFANASAQRVRIQELVRTDAAARSQLDRQIAAEKDAQGAVITAEADLRSAQVNLNYTSINSPITGEVGRTNVTVGNVVGPDSGVLTTIVSRDPMYVTFPVSQRELLKFQQEEREQKQKRQEALSVAIRFADDTVYGEKGTINFVDVTVNRATDTVTVRATLPNPRGTLIDGQLVRVLVGAEQPEEKVVIPQSALIADQKGIYVFVVADGQAAIRRVRPGSQVGADIVIEAGLSGGEQVVVQGLEALRPGAPVRASPVAPLGGQG